MTFPSKNTMEYNMSEMQHLFAEFDINSPMTSSSSRSFSHSINPSSSSTETSPESYAEANHQVPDIFHQNNPRIIERPEYFEQRCEQFLQTPQYFKQKTEFPDRRAELPRPEFPDRRPEFPNRRPEFPDRRPEFPDRRQEYPERRSEESFRQDFCDTPFIIRRQRPIVGRKLMASTETLPKIEEMDTFWSPNDFAQQTPPESNAYELFPAENKGFEFRTPVKNTSPTYSSTPISPISNITMSPNSPKLVPISPKLVPQLSNPIPMSPILPNSQRTGPKKLPVITKSQFPQRFLFHDKPCTSQNSQNFSVNMCTFCRKNGETPLVYMAHSVKEKIENRNIVTCPILRRHVCPICGATGDNAHTITYCPVLRSTNNGQPLRSTTITLKNTRVKSNGRRRF